MVGRKSRRAGSFSVAEIPEERGAPFDFATGYGPSGIGPRFAHHPVIKKPFDMAALEATLPSAG